MQSQEQCVRMSVELCTLYTFTVKKKGGGFFGYTGQHGGSYFPDQGLNLCPALGAQSLNQWTTRKFQYFLKSSRGELWRRQWHPTPVLLPGKSHGRRSLVGCSPWDHKESDTTERLHFHFSLACLGEGNGNPLHCSCLENSRDGGA